MDKCIYLRALYWRLVVLIAHAIISSAADFE